MDLRSYCRLLQRRWLVIVCTFLLVGVALVGAGFLIPKAYTATVQMVCSPDLPSDATMETRQLAGVYMAARMETYAQVVTTDAVLQPVIGGLHLDVSVPELVDSLDVSIPSDTSVIEVKVSAPTAKQAASTANSIASQMQSAVTVLEGSATVVRVDILQPAAPPLLPTSPNIRLNTAIAFVLALLSAIFAAVLVDTFGARLKKRRDVTALGVAFLGGVPKGGDAKAGDLLPFTEQTSDLRAIYERIAGDVLYAVGERPACVLFTAPRSGTGKTAVAANVAGALAAAGYRVAFVDADLRDGRLGARVGLAEMPGIHELASGRVEIGDPLFQQSWGGFSVIPVGGRAIDVGPLLAGEKFGDVLNVLAGHVDVIIVDAPSMTNASEPARFTQNIENVVVVAEAGGTRRADVLRVTDSLRETRARVLGVVLFAVRKAEEPAPADSEDRYERERPDHADERPRHAR